MIQPYKWNKINNWRRRSTGIERKWGRKTKDMYRYNYRDRDKVEIDT